jgi:glyceraldehyde 3-phosphate dehydrogenase
MIKIAINGLGRIGRTIIRCYAENPRNDIQIVAINGPAENAAHAHLLKYDSVHGRLCKEITHDDKHINFGFGDVPVFHERNIENIPWDKHEVDIVLECTGKFNNGEQAKHHKARKVIISAPAENVDATIVMGVNHNIIQGDERIISIGSCTTNCLAPLAKILHKNIGINNGFMTTIHSYTSDQNLLDGSHKDMRRARAAGLSMVPTSTGAAKALGLVIPELAGKLNGTAIRVPTPNVSLVDLCFTPNRKTSKEEVNNILLAAANGEMRGILGICNEPLVSCDFIGRSESSIADLSQTYIVDGDDSQMVRVCSWYDNEWGFSERMLDACLLF